MGNCSSEKSSGPPRTPKQSVIQPRKEAAKRKLKKQNTSESLGSQDSDVVGYENQNWRNFVNPGPSESAEYARADRW